MTATESVARKIKVILITKFGTEMNPITYGL